MRYQKPFKSKNESGMALFMVLSAITVLSILVTEFTYVAQVNSRMATDSSNTIRARSLAMTGLKISLLRLKIYREIIFLSQSNEQTGAAIKAVPRSLLQQIWAFPFIYPIPNTMPGLSMGAKMQLEKFEKESSLKGNYTAIIEPEDSRLNLNLALIDFLPTIQPSTNPSTNPNSPSSPIQSDPVAQKSTGPDVEASREGLRAALDRLISQELENDTNFRESYNGFKTDELWDNILSWIDYAHQSRTRSLTQKIPYKRAPMYDLTELRQIAPIDDTLYDFFSSHVTATVPTGVNINQMGRGVLSTLLPDLIPAELDDFFAYRDSKEDDNLFGSVDAFWKYLKEKTRSYSDSNIDRAKEEFVKRGIRLTVEEDLFRIKVKAQVEDASRTLEALVQVHYDKSSAAKKAASASSGDTPVTQTPTANSGSLNPLLEDFKQYGMRILFVRLF